MYRSEVRVAPEMQQANRRAMEFCATFQRGQIMLRYALIFLVVALLAGVFGFFGLEGTAMEIARILFFVFIVLFVISLVTGRRVPIE